MFPAARIGFDGMRIERAHAQRLAHRIFQRAQGLLRLNQGSGAGKFAG